MTVSTLYGILNLCLLPCFEILNIWISNRPQNYICYSNSEWWKANRTLTSECHTYMLILNKTQYVWICLDNYFFFYRTYVRRWTKNFPKSKSPPKQFIQIKQNTNWIHKSKRYCSSNWTITVSNKRFKWMTSSALPSDFHSSNFALIQLTMFILI